jgi:hypothetical protein
VVLAAGDPHLERAGYHGAVVPGDVALREDGAVADYLPIRGVDGGAVLLGEAELCFAAVFGPSMMRGDGIEPPTSCL